jgi:O-antigen/teichoic acid export membrane protein
VYLLKRRHQLRSLASASPLARELAHNSTLAGFSFVYDLFLVGSSNILLGHVLGVRALGVYTSTQALVALIYGFTNLGVQVTASRQVSRAPELANVYLGNCLAIRLTLSLPATILIALVLGNLFKIGSPFLLCLWSLYVSIVGIYGLILGAVQAKNRFDLSTSVLLMGRTLWAVVLGTAATLSQNIELVLFALCFSQVFTLKLALVALKRTGKSPKLRWDLAIWRQIIGKSIPVALASSAEVVNLRADNVLVASISGSTSAGIYSSAYNLYYFGIVPGYAATLGAFPTLARTATQSHSYFTQLLMKMAALIALAGIGSALALAILAENLVALLYARNFHTAVMPTRILAIAIPFVVLNRFMVQALNASDRQRWTFCATGTGALFNVISNLFLIPRYGYLGAGVTTVLTEAIVVVIAWIGVSRSPVNRKL